MGFLEITNRNDSRHEEHKVSTKLVDDTSIAIIGMSCRFPGAQSIEEFWMNLRQGVESVTFFSDQELIEAGSPGIYPQSQLCKSGMRNRRD